MGSWRWLRVVAVILAALGVSRAYGKGNRVSPLAKGGNIGLGLVVGEPGDWGVSGKIWLSGKTAIQPALNIDHGVVAQADFLWHTFGLIHPERGVMPLYLGVGGATDFEHAFGVRGPVGLTYLFDSVPLDLYVELVPTLWFFNGGSDFKLDGGLGSRYYF